MMSGHKDAMDTDANNYTPAELEARAVIEAEGGYFFEFRGWACSVYLGWTDAGPGLRREPEIRDAGKPRIVDRAYWDECYPGIEPTETVLMQIQDEASDTMLQDAIDEMRMRSY